MGHIWLSRAPDNSFCLLCLYSGNFRKMRKLFGNNCLMQHFQKKIFKALCYKNATSCSEGVNQLWLWIECGAFLVAHDVDTAWVILRSHLAQLDIWFRKSRFSSPHANAFSPLANHFKNVKKSENPNDWKFCQKQNFFVPSILISV